MTICAEFFSLFHNMCSCAGNLYGVLTLILCHLRFEGSTTPQYPVQKQIKFSQKSGLAQTSLSRAGAGADPRRVGL